MKKTRHHVKPPVHALTPNEIVRKSHAGPYFGLRPTQLDKLIRDGVIPTPFKLSASGRARGWLGQTILDYQRKLAEQK